MKKITLFLLLTITVQFSFAQTINTESPSFSAGGMTLQKNIFQMETNFGVNFYIPFDGSNQSYLLPTTLLRYGITDRIEIRANPTMISYNDVYSLTSFLVGAKFNLIGQKEEKIQLSVIANYGFPMTRSSIHFEANTILTFNYDFAKKHSLGANLGYHFQDLRSVTTKTYSNDFFATLIYNYQIFENLSCFIEGKWNADLRYYTPNFANIPPSNNTSHNYYWDAGLLFKINNKIQIDYVYGMDFDNSTRFHMLGLHFMLDFNKK